MNSSGLWSCEGLENGKGTELGAEGPARLGYEAVLRLPQLPDTSQVICLCLSLSSPITLRIWVMMRSTDLMLLFAAGHAAFPPVGWQMLALPFATLAAQPSLCLLLSRVEMKADRGNFYKQTKKRYLKFNTIPHLDVWDPPHG